MKLTPALASHFARITLGHIDREYPHLLSHVFDAEGDVRAPRQLHPVFFGSFDWHSCVHGWWTLLTLRRLFPDLPEAAAISALAEATFTAEKIAGELAYRARASARNFERPYGWAWLLTLHLEAERHPDHDWGRRLRPLAAGIAADFPHYLAILTYPIRSGTHANSAFAALLALAWANRFDPPLGALLRERVLHWFSADRDCQAWEPGGDEFLSPCLSEALCMARCLPPVDAAAWLATFLPRISAGEPAALFRPAVVSDRTDSKIAHLDGLNLSRAWCWRGLAGHLRDEARVRALAAAHDHLASALPHLADHYAGEHWLASFALLALLEPSPVSEP